MDAKQLFESQGYLVIENFYTSEACEELMKRGMELAENYDYQGHASVFQTTEQAKTSDDYFLESGDKISFFFEKDAFDSEGKLKNSLFKSLNKIGHALHDLDPVFNNFSRSPQLQQLSE